MAWLIILPRFNRDQDVFKDFLKKNYSFYLKMFQRKLSKFSKTQYVVILLCVILPIEKAKIGNRKSIINAAAGIATLF